MKLLPKTSQFGFTLIELLVVITVIGILATVGVSTYSGVQGRGRDAVRRDNLHKLAIALQSYYNDHGKYPCTVTNADGTCQRAWWGESINYGSHTTDYIPGLAPTYIRVLPNDPNVNKDNITKQCGTQNAGYLYESDGTDYKVLAFCSPEETWTNKDPFYDPAPDGTGAWRGTTSWAIYTDGAVNW